MLFKIILTMHNWIKADPKNVAVVHCVVCYLNNQKINYLKIS